MKNITAAGIIIFRVEGGIPLFLGLKALPKFKKQGKGIYDIPKGRLDAGETPFEAAKRECFEESGIKPIKIVAGPFIDGPLAVWLGETDKSIIAIGKNPDSGIIEHEGYSWMTTKELEAKCLVYLKPSVTWAHNKIWEYFKI